LRVGDGPNTEFSCKARTAGSGGAAKRLRTTQNRRALSAATRCSPARWHSGSLDVLERASYLLARVPGGRCDDYIVLRLPRPRAPFDDGPPPLAQRAEQALANLRADYEAMAFVTRSQHVDCAARRVNVNLQRHGTAVIDTREARAEISRGRDWKGFNWRGGHRLGAGPFWAPQGPRRRKRLGVFARGRQDEMQTDAQSGVRESRHGGL
jgi:hypothetical protein